MNISGTALVMAPAAQVWQVLISPEEISACVPGLTSWQTVQPNQQFSLLLAWGRPPHTVYIPILLTWTAVTPPPHLALYAEATLMNQTITTLGNLHLHSATPTTTHIGFTVTPQTSQENSFIKQLIRQTAPRFIDAFFKNIQTHLQNTS
jgi:carbon monoxide dehydrogenase subunit G